MAITNLDWERPGYLPNTCFFNSFKVPGFSIDKDEHPVISVSCPKNSTSILISYVRISFIDAINSTVAKVNLSIFCLNLSEPSQAPVIPPIKAIATSGNISVSNFMPFENRPASPAIEFTKINKALIAAVCFWFVHFNSNKMGERMIPPPMPINPERNPILPPISNEAGQLAFLRSFSSGFGKKKNRATGKSNKTPRIFLYTSASNEMVLPMNEIGMDAKANGKNSFHLKCPPLKNNRKEVRDTKRFRISAEDFIVSGANPYRAINAK